MSPANRQVLVTGGAGFIGSHLSETLLQCGYRVRILDNLSQGRREWIPASAEFIEGDISDFLTCRRACAGIDGIFHMAAMSRAGPSGDLIEQCTRDNIIGTQHVLMAARECSVRKLVYAGSSTYYGNRVPPHREYDDPDLLNAYALSKYVGERYSRLFDRAYGVQTVIMRYFNVYGPRQPQVGSYALVLGIFLRQWMARQPLTIHGEGSQRRDFVHVRDVVVATVRAFESEVHGDAFNVGSGTNVSIKELADLISPYQVFHPRRPQDAAETLADLTRTREILGWEPSIGFREGLLEMMALMKEGTA